MRKLTPDKLWVLVLVSWLVIVFAAFTGQAADTLVILHTNDTHARLEPFKPWGAEQEVGGQVRLASLVEEVRAEYPGKVLLLDAGDAWHGTNIANVFQGESVVEVMNAMGYDAMVLGNHDFNYGQEVLAERMAQAEFPVLAANVIKEATGEVVGTSALLKTVGGVKVGIIGLSTPDTPVVTHPKNVEGLVFADPVERAQSLVSYLEPKVDLIIALTHLGLAADKELAEAVPGIDVIVGGHSHTRLAAPVIVGNTYIVQAGEHTEALGYLELTIDNGEITGFARRLLPVTAQTPEQPVVADIVAKWGAELNAKMEQVVGTAAVGLDGERGQVRTRETNLGNLITDIMRETVGADVAVNNGGGIRASINEGPITVGEVYTVLPFDNTLVKLEVTGEDLLAVLEHGVSKYPETAGAFLQVSGLEFTFDPSREPGHRVTNVLVGGKPLSLNKTYTLATNDFMAAGGDGYEMLKTAPRLLETGDMLRDVVVEYIAEKGTIAPQVEGRITVVE